MSPLPFLFKQQLKYYTSNFAQPLPSFSKKPTNKQKDKQTQTKKLYQIKPANEKSPINNSNNYVPFSRIIHSCYHLLLFLPSKFNILEMLDHSPSFVQGAENQLST